VATSSQVSHACFPDWGSDGWRKELRWCRGEVFFKNPAKITECFSDGQRVGVLVSKPRGGRSPRLNVGVAVAPGNDQDHPAAEGTMVLVLSAVVPWAFCNAKVLQGVD
jgi:hypothetical protein